ncbi:MAG: 16S rRNA (cytosine(1402)-N(4))-methyltransferase RsmH [Phascolarctobacterium sp.]|nr:16S rRNA (cytosine(1402)-N(4))-methyltransferase RsmH [Candidatus Phascolarctobacterium caballi]
MEFQHISILLQESVDFLIRDAKGIYLDCTLGGAGHSCAFAECLDKDGTLIGIDRDKDAIEISKQRLLNKFKCKIEIEQANFKDLTDVLDKKGIEKVDGIFFDLGVSSYQLDCAERGFSYMHNGPLDMRMNQEIGIDAKMVVNTYSEEILAKLIWKYGEERWAKRIAKFIVQARKEKQLATTGELVEVIKKAIPKGARQEGAHPAKRTFQAIRIEVNNELNILEQTMRQGIERLESNGRIGVITFHSLEDRIVKQVFAELQKGCICPPHLPCVCGKKPVLQKVGSVKPSVEEITKNSRARSARLRYAVKI